MTVCRGGIQQLSCHAQSQSVPVPSGGKVIEELSLCVFFAEIPRYPRRPPAYCRRKYTRHGRPPVR